MTKIGIFGSMKVASDMVVIAESLVDMGLEIELPPLTYHYAETTDENELYCKAVENKIKFNVLKAHHEIIEESDKVLVVNNMQKGINNYIGPQSFVDMNLAYLKDKPLYLLNPIPQTDFYAEIAAMEPTIIHGDLEKLL